MRYAWSHVRLDAAHNLGLNLLSTPEEWGKLGDSSDRKEYRGYKKNADRWGGNGRQRERRRK
jgi:hypothetical protein